MEKSPLSVRLTAYLHPHALEREKPPSPLQPRMSQRLFSSIVSLFSFSHSICPMSAISAPLLAL